MGRAALLLLAASVFGGAAGAYASVQTASPQAASLPTASPSAAQPPSSTAAHHKHGAHRPTRHHPKPSPAVQAPVTPPRPVPPAEQQPTAANVQFSQGNLTIEAQNSSLSQILMQVSHDTGMSVEGLNHDERIYGNYGPGSVTATLTKLLDGAGYDYVIVGGEDGGAPAKLLLTASNGPVASTSPAPAATSPAPAATSPPAENPAGAFVPPPNPSDTSRPKTPQEIFDELRKMHSH